jgi:hypothetical protein
MYNILLLGFTAFKTNGSSNYPLCSKDPAIVAYADLDEYSPQRAIPFY